MNNFNKKRSNEGKQIVNTETARKNEISELTLTRDITDLIYETDSPAKALTGRTPERIEQTL